MDFTTIEWSQLSAIAIMAICVIAVIYFMLQMSKVNATVQQQAQQASREIIVIAAQSFKENAAESRSFYVSKLEDMRAGVRLLEDRVRELEEQIEDKDERITELERENESLKLEVDVLRKRMNGAAKKPATRKKVA